MLIAINESVIQMDSVLQQLNTSSLINTNMLNDLEAEMEQGLNQLKSDIETINVNMDHNIETIKTLEANISSLKNAYGTLRMNLTYLEAETETTNDAIQNSNDVIATLFNDIAVMNESTADSFSRLSTQYTEIKGIYIILHLLLEERMNFKDVKQQSILHQEDMSVKCIRP